MCKRELDIAICEFPPLRPFTAAQFVSGTMFVGSAVSQCQCRTPQGNNFQELTFHSYHCYEDMGILERKPLGPWGIGDNTAGTPFVGLISVAPQIQLNFAQSSVAMSAYSGVEQTRALQCEFIWSSLGSLRFPSDIPRLQSSI